MGTSTFFSPPCEYIPIIDLSHNRKTAQHVINHKPNEKRECPDRYSNSESQLRRILEDRRPTHSSNVRSKEHQFSQEPTKHPFRRQVLGMLVLPVMEYSLMINDSSHTTTGDETDVRAFAESVLGAGRKADSFVEAALAMLDGDAHTIRKGWYVVPLEEPGF